VHFHLEILVVLVEQIDVLWKPTGAGLAETSDDGFDDLLAQSQKTGEDTDPAWMDTVLSGSLDALNQRFAPQLGEVVAGLPGCLVWPGVRV